jgi:Prokaryotic E2 family E
MSVVETIDDLLPEVDRVFLAEKNLRFSASRVGADTHVVIHEFDFPAAYTPRKANLLIILPAGYPNANLDMFWTEPVVKLANGNWPDRADNHGTYNGISWQRWSRHFQTAWRQSVDNLRTFVTTIRKELARGV